MAMKGVYSDMFILHDPSQVCISTDRNERTLSKQWIPFYKFQPLDKIRDYFGEKITFYFAWEGTFLTVLWPAAVIGTICFTYVSQILHYRSQMYGILENGESISLPLRK
uniref:Anoctamin n=1 Tax=Parascaris equorum TaxID=6256 RepID=A0A914RAN5_PAREQ